MKATSRRLEVHPPLKHEHAPNFWDDLSFIPLTFNAIKELERRTSGYTNRRVRSLRSYRKRLQPISQSATELLQCFDERSLNNLRRSSRRGGPAMTDLRGFPNPGETMSMGTLRSKRTGPYDPAFERHLYEFNIHFRGEALFPVNFDEIKARAQQKRRPSLNDGTVLKTIQNEIQSQGRLDENKMRNKILPLVLGQSQDQGCSINSAIFTNIKPLTDGSITRPMPDYSQGIKLSDIPSTIRISLNKLICPIDELGTPWLPNFFVALKGRGGLEDVALRQTCYDGAIGARAMHALQSFANGRPDYDNKASTIACALTSTALEICTVHLLSENGRPKCIMQTLRVWHIRAHDFAEGLQWIRNLAEWAKEQRTRAIDAAKLSLRPNFDARPLEDVYGVVFTQQNDVVSPSEQPENNQLGDLSPVRTLSVHEEVEPPKDTKTPKKKSSPVRKRSASLEKGNPGQGSSLQSKAKRCKVDRQIANSSLRRSTRLQR